MIKKIVVLLILSGCSIQTTLNPADGYVFIHCMDENDTEYDETYKIRQGLSPKSIMRLNNMKPPKVCVTSYSSIPRENETSKPFYIYDKVLITRK